MQYVIEGLFLGLSLSFLLGPIFIVLVQSSLEQGSKAGFLAASGIWFSDIVIVILSLRFVRKISPYVQSGGFVFWVGLMGGIVLIAVGIATFMKRPVINFDQHKITRSGMFSHWMKGFMVNTINPFTFIFWLTTITTFVGRRQLTVGQAWLFTGAILFVIVVTDALKVLLQVSPS